MADNNPSDTINVNKILVDKYNAELKHLVKVSESLTEKRDSSKTRTKEDYYQKKLSKNNNKVLKVLLKLNQMVQE